MRQHVPAQNHRMSPDEHPHKQISVSEYRALLRFIDLNLNPDKNFSEEPEISKKDILYQTLQDVYVDHQEGYYQHAEEEILYNNRQIEDRLTSIIENGDINGLQEFSKDARNTARFGSISKDQIRQLKITFIIATTIVSRAAIRGGLSPVFAFLTSDLYMKKAETLWDSESIYQLLQAMQHDFCSRVAVARQKTIENNEVMRAMEFVHAHLNQKINVSDVADAVGLSRSYLSRKFKQELGFSLNSFIRRCKLEEAKSLLRYSDHSISHISEYLCFSSQSNFQNLFKEQYHLTPAQYRRSNRK